MVSFTCLFFFFSSRRRHTRFKCDWSSDVCSSDLFVERCDTDPNRRAVIEALLSLASRFGAQLVAEGVQTAEVVETLRGLGVSLMQGYLFAMPLTASAAARYALTSDFAPARPILSPRDAVS